MSGFSQTKFGFKFAFCEPSMSGFYKGWLDILPDIDYFGSLN